MVPISDTVSSTLILRLSSVRWSASWPDQLTLQSTATPKRARQRALARLSLNLFTLSQTFFCLTQLSRCRVILPWTHYSSHLLISGVIFQRSSRVKRVTVLSLPLLKIQRKPTRCKRGKVRTVYVRHLLQCCKRQLLMKTEITLKFFLLFSHIHTHTHTPHTHTHCYTSTCNVWFVELPSCHHCHQSKKSKRLTWNRKKTAIKIYSRKNQKICVFYNYTFLREIHELFGA
jgi:hypothetical protein